MEETQVVAGESQDPTKVPIRNIETGLIGKNDVFKMLQLAECLGLPILLIGEPGVSKTACVLDYARSDEDAGDPYKKSFILETDEGTRSSEVKGVLNVKALVQDNEYKLLTPIADAEYVVINEVDKASSGVRNSLLGVMNEKLLFNGELKIPCKWRLFVATCNSIPKEEEGNPFWDRFMLKLKVNRISAGEMLKYFKSGGKDFKMTVKLNCPTEDQIKAVVIAPEKLEIFIQHVGKVVSDRTLSFAPLMAAVISLVYSVGIDKSLVKACEIMTQNLSLAKDLDKKLSPQEKRKVMDKVDLLTGIQDGDQLNAAIQEIENLVNTFKKTQKLNDEDVSEIEKAVNEALANNPAVEEFEVLASEMDKADI